MKDELKQEPNQESKQEPNQEPKQEFKEKKVTKDDVVKRIDLDQTQSDEEMSKACDKAEEQQQKKVNHIKFVTMRKR